MRRAPLFGVHLPIRIRQFPRFAANLVRRALLWPVRPKRATTFRVCYFTCRSHFRYLYCSIHSLSVVKTAATMEILVFCDRDELFSAEQIKRLHETGVAVKVIPWPKSEGWGSAQIASIWDAYELAIRDAVEGTYITCVDSDVFFFSGWLFDFVTKSHVDMIGDGRYVDFKYAQGGVYFLSAEAVGRILAVTPIATFDREFRQAHVDVEDKALYFLARKARLRIRLACFMMFPDEYARAGRLSWYQRHKFACLHYAIRDKAPLIDIYLDQMISVRERSRFVEILDT